MLILIITFVSIVLQGWSFLFTYLFVFGIFIVALELCARLINNKLIFRSKLEKNQLSLKFGNLDNSNAEPNFPDEELQKLNREYGEHVKRCMVHYGTWSNAIKSEESMHMPDYQGQYLNVVSGLRVTTDSPAISKKRIIIFGGSTVFCGEVPDKLTSCSFLQNIFNQNKISATVINYGRHGSTLQNRLLYLERSEFNRNDLILFWFGVNELGWKLMEGKTNIPSFILLLNRLSDGLKFFSQYFSLCTFLSQIFDYIILEPVARIFSYFDLKRSFEKLEHLSQLRGFEYRVFLQPNLLTKTSLTYREQVTSDFFLSRRSGRITKRLLDKNYPKFRSLLVRYKGIDASAIFRETTQEVFVDWCHLNSVGNQIAAEFIFEFVEGNGLLE